MNPRVCLLVLVAAPSIVRAQQITVAVDINDTTANRVVQGAFVAAFRSLATVAVVSAAEKPDYVLSGLVLCQPLSCQDPVSYSASLRLWSPVSDAVANHIALSTVSPEPFTTFTTRIDSVATKVVWPLISAYEQTRHSWIVTWGRSRYEQAIRELVREIDVQCFETRRALRRASPATDSAVARSIVLNIAAGRSWFC